MAHHSSDTSPAATDVTPLALTSEGRCVPPRLMIERLASEACISVQSEVSHEQAITNETSMQSRLRYDHGLLRDTQHDSSSHPQSEVLMTHVGELEHCTQPVACFVDLRSDRVRPLRQPHLLPEATMQRAAQTKRRNEPRRRLTQQHSNAGTALDSNTATALTETPHTPHRERAARPAQDLERPIGRRAGEHALARERDLAARLQRVAVCKPRTHACEHTRSEGLHATQRTAAHTADNAWRASASVGISTPQSRETARRCPSRPARSWPQQLPW